MSETTDRIKRQRMLTEIREGLKGVKSAAQRKKDSEALYKENTSLVLPMMLEVDGPNGKGIRFEFEDQEYAAIACQPDAGKLWDTPALITELKKRGVWQKVSTTQLDPQKLAAEIEAGNLPSFEEFMLDAPEKSAYVKFVNPKPENL